MRSKQYDILVVSDDPEDRMIMGEAFAALNCADRLTMYESGYAFHQEMLHLRSLHPLPYVTVLDYNLPGPDAADVLRLLQSDPVLCAIPVFMYSTGMSRTQKQDCESRGAVGCFEKGAIFAEVLSFCRRLIQTADAAHHVA